MTRSALLLALAAQILSASARAQAPWFRVSSPLANTGFGWDIAGCGDCNGDGVPDVLVGSPGDSSVFQTGGSAQLLSGLDGSVIRGWQGSGVLAQFGSPVASAGDIDGDGVDDLLIGAPGDSSGAPSGGCVYAYSGASGALLFSFTGPAGSQLGSALSGAGDLDHDGHADVIVGAYGDSSVFSGAGRVEVLSGATGTSMITLIGAPGDYLGTAVAGIGDTNGDGTDDFVVGSSLYSQPGANYIGRVTVHSGVDGSLLRTIVGSATFAGLGGRVARAGDVDQDGTPDFAASAFGAGFPGEVYLYSGASGSVLRSFSGDRYLDAFGESLGGALDVNGDGVPDLAIGAQGGYSRTYSGANGQLLYELRSPLSQEAQILPMRATLVRDVDGDGRADLVVSVPGAPSYSQSHGDVRVYTDATPRPVGSGYCFGDGSGTACPCVNNGAAGGGCANSTGSGAVLESFGTSSASADDAWFKAHDLPPGVTTLLFTGTQPAGAGSGVPLYDGLRCVGGTLHRLGVRPALGTGVAYHPSGLGFIGGWTAGTTAYVQLQYRDGAGPCAHGSNFSNGLSITFGP
jgi:FG-GAP repeat